MPSIPIFAQTPATSKTVLPLVPNRFQMKKEQWTMADRAWIERDAITHWLENAQPSLFWLEGDGVETFAYSQVTEWEMDRLLMLSRDPRILESFRKYYEWCGLNTLPENDGETFVMDIAGNGCTTPKELPNLGGYYNHIFSVLPAARPFQTRYDMTGAEREKRIANWFQNPIAPADRPTGRDMTSGYHPFHSYPMYFEPLGMWTQSDQERRAQLLKLPTLSQPRFTRYFNVETGKELSVRAPSRRLCDDALGPHRWSPDQGAGFGVAARFRNADSFGQRRAAIETVKDKHGRIDVLFVNAGIAAFAPIAQVDEAAFDKHFDINVKGAYFVIKYAAPIMPDGASIILTASASDTKGMPGTTVYGATKAALRSFGRTFAGELAPRRIRVNTISPGPIDTPILGKGGDASPAEIKAMMDGIIAQVPLGRIGQAAEVAAAALYFASDESKFTTGTELFVDGGMTQI